MLTLAWLLPLVLAGGWGMYRLAVERSRLQLRLDTLDRKLGVACGGLPAGSLLGDFELPGLWDGARRLSEWRGRKVLLLFFSPDCPYCLHMVSNLCAVTPARLAADPVPLVITTGDAEENRRLFSGHPIAEYVLLQEGAEVASLCRVQGTPAGYRIDEQGRTAGKLMVGAEPFVLLLSPADV